jgi:hypothetical protein
MLTSKKKRPDTFQDIDLVHLLLSFFQEALHSPP